MTQQPPQQFSGEESPSSRSYPAEYRLNPLDQQISTLGTVFPRLADVATATGSTLPAGAEGWFAVPRWEALAPTYNEAVGLVLAALTGTRDTSLWRIDRLGPDHLRQHERTRAKFASVHTGETPIIAVAAQFGLRHRGRSIRHARERFEAREYGLGVFAIACMLLTHPERLRQANQLYVDCAGDEYSASDEEQFSEAPFFRFIDGRVGFGTSWIGYVDPYFGSASTFIP